MYFIDCETHIWDPMDDISYYPNFKKYQDSPRYLMCMFDKQPQKHLAPADELIKSMDEGGVAKACVLEDVCADFPGCRCNADVTADCIPRYCIVPARYHDEMTCSKYYKYLRGV